MSWLLRLGMRHGWRRGVIGGNRAWVVIGGAAVVGHLAGRALRSEPDVVFLEKLEPGESLMITHERRT